MSESKHIGENAVANCKIISILKTLNLTVKEIMENKLSKHTAKKYLLVSSMIGEILMIIRNDSIENEISDMQHWVTGILGILAFETPAYMGFTFLQENMVRNDYIFYLNGTTYRSFNNLSEEEIMEILTVDIPRQLLADISMYIDILTRYGTRFDVISADVGEIMNDLSSRIGNADFESERPLFNGTISMYEYGSAILNSIDTLRKTGDGPSILQFMFNRIFDTYSNHTCTPICINFVSPDGSYDDIRVNMGNGDDNKVTYNMDDFINNSFRPYLSTCNEKTIPVLFSNSTHATAMIISIIKGTIIFYFYDPNGNHPGSNQFLEFLEKAKTYLESDYNVQIVDRGITCRRSIQDVVVPTMYDHFGYCISLSTLYMYVLLILMRKGYDPHSHDIGVVCSQMINYLEKLDSDGNRNATNFAVNFANYISGLFISHMINNIENKSNDDVLFNEIKDRINDMLINYVPKSQVEKYQMYDEHNRIFSNDVKNGNYRTKLYNSVLQHLILYYYREVENTVANDFEDDFYEDSQDDEDDNYY